MKNHLFSSTFLLLLTLTASAQQMPLDFESDTHAFTEFDGSGFAFVGDPATPGNTVGQFFNDGSNASQGFFLELSEPVNFDDGQEITLEFYAFDPLDHEILLVFEDEVNPDVQIRQGFSVPSPSDWTNLTFDFANAELVSDGSPVSASGAYGNIRLFIDEGSTQPGTYLIDNINNGSEAQDPHELDVIYTDLVWADEFDVDGPVNSDNWFHQTILPNGVSWFNGELQHYTDRIENSFVENGELNIKAIREPFVDQGVLRQFTSARLNSKFAFTYGRVDVRAKLPLGEGTWPAIWTLGQNVIENGGYWSEEFGEVFWPACGEIDIMEHGLGETNSVSCALHSPCEGCFGNTMNTEYFPLENVAENYHIYSVNWSPDQITFMVDGVGYFTYSPEVQDGDTWPFATPHYLLLNVAMGGFAGDVEASFQESSMVIDYVRVYQNVLSTDDAFAEKFKVYPNPANDFIRVESEESIDRIEMFNTLGQLVDSKVNPNGVLDISELDNGVYLLRIYSGEKVGAKKVVVK
ncbi:MAG: family 16 glycosylhydrolase [Bacteroidota bacterium]